MKLRLRYLSLAGLVAVGSGCATTIAERHPHLDRRSVCLLVPGIENDSTGYIFNENNVPVSNFHLEVVDRVAANARTVFEYDPDADPESVRYLPAPYNELTCPEQFSMLPSKNAETPPPPQASLDLLVHESRPERVPMAIAEKLASCATQSRGQLQASQYTATLNVYLKNDGRAVSALVVESTLGDRNMEACMVRVLRATQWSVAETVPIASAAVGLGARMFFAQGQSAPVEPLPDSVPESGIRRIQPQPLMPPAGAPGGGTPGPRIFVIPLGPIAAAVAVFGIIYFWSSDDSPAWADELNPITRQPYSSLQEYEAVKQMTPQQIQAAQRAQGAAAAAKPTTTMAAPPVAGSRRNPGQTCDDAVLDELEKQKKDICYSEQWTCSDTFEKIGKKKEKLLTCAELLPRVARAKACLNARLRVQAECYAGSPEAKHDGQIETIRKGVTECVDKAAVRGPSGGPCQ